MRFYTFLKHLLFILVFSLFAEYSFSQTTDTLTIINADSSAVSEVEMTESDVLYLLPEQYLPIQGLLWKEDGLMRDFNRFKLTEQNRDFELDLRDNLFKVHRLLGYTTLAGMLTQGIIFRLYICPV